MINTIVWCAMSIGYVPVHAEGVILATGKYYHTVRFAGSINAVRKERCTNIKPKGASLIPLEGK